MAVLCNTREGSLGLFYRSFGVPGRCAFVLDDPRNFYVYPGIASGQNAFIEIVFSNSPTDLANTSATISVDDIYANAIIDFVLYRAYMKDAEYAGNAQRAQNHYQLFTASIGQGGQAQTLLDPNNDPVSNIGAVPRVMQQQGR